MITALKVVEISCKLGLLELIGYFAIFLHHLASILCVNCTLHVGRLKIHNTH